MYNTRNTEYILSVYNRIPVCTGVHKVRTYAHIIIHTLLYIIIYITYIFIYRRYHVAIYIIPEI